MYQTQKISRLIFYLFILYDYCINSIVYALVIHTQKNKIDKNDFKVCKKLIITFDICT